MLLDLVWDDFELSWPGNATLSKIQNLFLSFFSSIWSGSPPFSFLLLAASEAATPVLLLLESRI
jgi:hypothetical protein